MLIVSPSHLKNRDVEKKKKAFRQFLTHFVITSLLHISIQPSFLALTDT